MSGSRFWISRWSGTEPSLSWSSNFHRPDSAANVTSKAPPVCSLIWCAISSTSRVSGLTGTARSPAAAFRRTISLPSFQTLMSASSRSNSPNTAPIAASARASSAVQTETLSSVPIVWCARSSRWAGGDVAPRPHPKNTAAAARSAGIRDDPRPKDMRGMIAVLVSGGAAERVDEAAPVVFGRLGDLGAAGQVIAVLAGPDTIGLDGDAERREHDVERRGNLTWLVEDEAHASVAHVDQLRAPRGGIHLNDAGHRLARPAAHGPLYLPPTVHERTDAREKIWILEWSGDE